MASAGVIQCRILLILFGLQSGSTGLNVGLELKSLRTELNGLVSLEETLVSSDISLSARVNSVENTALECQLTESTLNNSLILVYQELRSISAVVLTEKNHTDKLEEKALRGIAVLKQKLLDVGASFNRQLNEVSYNNTSILQRLENIGELVKVILGEKNKMHVWLSRLKNDTRENERKWNTTLRCLQDLPRLAKQIRVLQENEKRLKSELKLTENTSTDLKKQVNVLEAKVEGSEKRIKYLESLILQLHARQTTSISPILHSTTDKRCTSDVVWTCKPERYMCGMIQQWKVSQQINQHSYMRCLRGSSLCTILINSIRTTLRGQYVLEFEYHSTSNSIVKVQKWAVHGSMSVQSIRLKPSGEWQSARTVLSGSSGGSLQLNVQPEGSNFEMRGLQVLVQRC